MSRQDRERRGIAVTGIMTLIWMMYTLALSQAADSGSEPPRWAWLVAVAFGLIILMALFVFDRWIKWPPP